MSTPMMRASYSTDMDEVANIVDGDDDPQVTRAALINALSTIKRIQEQVADMNGTIGELQRELKSVRNAYNATVDHYNLI